MKRTLTILAIAAAMITFVACGKKSHDDQVASPEATVVFPTGDYSGKQDIGIFKVAATTDEHKKILSDLKKERMDLEVSMNKWFDDNGVDPVLLYQGAKVTMLDKAVTARLEANQSAISRLDTTIAEIEKELIDFKITFIDLKVSKTLDGNYKVSGLKILTDKDNPDYARNKDGEIIYYKGKPIIYGEEYRGHGKHQFIPKGFVFGLPELMNEGQVDYHAQSGSLSFSVLNKGVKYTFTGEVKTDEKGESVISGNIEMSDMASGMQLQSEPWKVSLISLPKPLGAKEDLVVTQPKSEDMAGDAGVSGLETSGSLPAPKSIGAKKEGMATTEEPKSEDMAGDAGVSRSETSGKISLPAIVAKEEEEKRE